MLTKRELLQLSAMSTGAALLPPWKWATSSADATQSGIKTSGKAPQKYVVVDAQFHHIPTAVYKRVDETNFTSKEGKTLQEKNRDPKAIAGKAYKLLQDLDATLRF